MSLQICSHCPIYVTQRHPTVYILPRGKLTCGVRGGMTSQALGGVNLPCGWYPIRGQPPLLEIKFTHTHMFMVINHMIDMRQKKMLSQTWIFSGAKVLIST
jgi:hypothetical protein